MEKHNPAAAAIFKALGDENRWRILETLKEGERCACVLLTRMQISQSTLSHHMKVLCDAGLITSRRDGKWTHYSLRPEGIQAAKGLLDGLLTASQQAPSLCACTKKEETIVEGKTKLYVLTGFLGSGKTTILLKLLEQLKGHRVGVIQNEFGKLSIDGEILRDGDIKMVELNRGSIFCTCLKLSFVQGLAEMAKQVKPSARGELEITTLNDMYLKQGELDVQLLGRGFAWLDTGTMDSLVDAADFVRMIEKRQGIKISAPEEIAFKYGWISRDKLLESAARYGKSPYGQHLKNVADGKLRY